MKKSKPWLKIGFVLDGGLEEPDGVQQYILSLGEYYKSLGHSIRYIVAGKAIYGGEDAISLGGSIGLKLNGNKTTIPTLKYSRSKLRKFLEEEKLDVLHVQVPYVPFLGERLVSLAHKDTAVVGTFHVVPYNFVSYIGDWLLGLWSRFSIRHFNSIVSVSSVARQVAKRDFGISTKILPNTINFDRFSNAEPLVGKEKALTILFLGRLVERKGCIQLLKAVKLLSEMKNLPKFKVVICGKGPLEAELKKYCFDNKIINLVKFEGFVSEEVKPHYYASADISVFPSLGGESFGIVLLEAMASGRSVVLAGDNGGYKSVMKEVPEILFPRRDESALADKLAVFLKDKSKRDEYAAWGKVFAADYDVKIIGDKLLGIYEEALLKRHTPCDNKV